MNQRTKWAIIGTMFLVAYGIGFLVMFDRPVAYEKPPPLTKTQHAACMAVKPEDRSTLINGTDAAWWTMKNGGIKVCYRRG